MITAIILVVGCSVFFYKRSLRYLRYLQQEEYHSLRFFRWIKDYQALDRTGTAILSIGFLGAILTVWDPVWAVASALTLTIRCLCEEDPRKTGKLRLKMTERATNIFRITLGLYCLTSIFLIYYNDWVWVGMIVCIQFTPAFLVISNLILLPIETRKQQGFLKEAKQILSKVSPYVIGITGSYGKTSTKDALAKILQVTLGPTFWPPKSINSPMGITREIRERLLDGYQFAIFEMGAYGIGSIKKLCDLTPPNAAIITGIGLSHLERFGSQENIYQAKSELAHALSSNGILVCNGDNPGSRKIASTFSDKKTLLYGLNNELGHLDSWISEWTFVYGETVFKLHWQGKIYQGKTSLAGQTALSNILAAFTMACALGANPEFVLAVVQNLEPVDNRLQIKREGEIYYVHDAYNSNPAGFAAAIDVVKHLPGKRRIIMTPGMIELGNRQFEENHLLAKLAGMHCDIALIVGKINQNSLSKGFLDAGLPKNNIYHCNNREHAFEQLAALKMDGDIILIENDLTDLYELQTKF